MKQLAMLLETFCMQSRTLAEHVFMQSGDNPLEPLSVGLRGEGSRFHITYRMAEQEPLEQLKAIACKVAGEITESKIATGKKSLTLILPFTEKGSDKLQRFIADYIALEEKSAALKAEVKAYGRRIGRLRVEVGPSSRKALIAQKPSTPEPN